MMRAHLKTAAIWAYVAGDVATFLFLIFVDAKLTWWNWPVAAGLSAFLAQIWPIYWAILRPGRTWLLS